jgi:hypothetical protein
MSINFLHSFRGGSTRPLALPAAPRSTICSPDVTDRFMQSLPDLHRRLAYMARLHADSRAVQDAAPVLRALRVKAVAKLRTFFWQRFDALRKPKTNIQIKQTVLVRHRRAFEFLLRNAGDVALELKQIYITIMSQVCGGGVAGSFSSL